MSPNKSSENLRWEALKSPRKNILKVQIEGPEKKCLKIYELGL